MHRDYSLRLENSYLAFFVLMNLRTRTKCSILDKRNVEHLGNILGDLRWVLSFSQGNSHPMESITPYFSNRLGNIVHSQLHGTKKTPTMTFYFNCSWYINLSLTVKLGEATIQDIHTHILYIPLLCKLVEHTLYITRKINIFLAYM